VPGTSPTKRDQQQRAGEDSGEAAQAEACGSEEKTARAGARGSGEETAKAEASEEKTAQAEACGSEEKTARAGACGSGEETAKAEASEEKTAQAEVCGSEEKTARAGARGSESWSAARTIYRTDNLPVALRDDLRVAVIGYGNQGRTHALNLRDSGYRVTVGQRPGRGADRARADGFEPEAIADAMLEAQLVIVALPDESASEVYAAEIAPVLRAGVTLGFIHGFNIHFGFITPPEGVDVVMIAPKGPGTLLRSLYREGKGLPALLAIGRDATGAARRTALTWASGIGALRAGVIETTFAAEAETDLFGEQVVLCGGVSALTKAAFETLVQAGYDPMFAYLECVHELKQIVDLLYEGGLSAMRERISNTAEYGDVTRGPRIVSSEVRREMRRVLEEIRSGAFAREWMEEHRRGAPNLRRLHDADVDTEFERAGRAVRALMPWLGATPPGPDPP
jgi:ketol-acid reductoisomerase